MPEQPPLDRRAHRDGVYASKASDAVSWFEPNPAVSLQLLDRIGLNDAT